ncbi:MAG: cation-transporting P-type ATPase, partial [Nitrospirae bacterium]|nr:cation-transporting P-type ATPase [Nitrospirota bacterium]
IDISNKDAERADVLMRVAVFCNNTKIINGEYRGDPTEIALFETGMDMLGDVKSERIYEIPFDFERKRMTTVYRWTGAQGFEESSKKTLESSNLEAGLCEEPLRPRILEPFEFVAYTKGAPETVLPLCSTALVNGKVIPLDDLMREKMTEDYNSMAGMGLRVLAFAYKELKDSNESRVTSRELKDKDLPLAAPHSLFESDMVFAGLIGLEDPPRSEVPQAIKKCKEAGIRIIMITGDSSRTAEAIAREIGLVKEHPVVIEGNNFLKMTDKELRSALQKRDIIFSRMSPKHKMRLVSVLKGEGEVVAVTGDGVNDAPALKKADIGIAMGITGTDVAKEASDMILLDDNFATIVNAVEEGRAVYENIRKFISYIFSSNIPEIIPYLAYVLFRIPLPLTIIQILAIDLGTDMFPALALGAEKPSPEVMRRPPRNPKERLLNSPTLSRAYLFLGPIEAAAGLFGFFYVLISGGWQWGDMPSSGNMLYLQATTACLTAIVITQVANVFACRSMRESVFTLGFFTNKLIFLGIAVELIIQLFIVYHPWGNAVFGTHPIGANLWLILLLFGIMLFFAEEMRKYIARLT